MTIDDLFEELLLEEERLTSALAFQERGFRLLDQLSHLDTTMLPPSVEAYLEDLNRSGLIATEGLIKIGTPIVDTISNILKTILDAIKWIIKSMFNIFRWIFDMYYRAQRKFIKQREFLLMFVDPKKQDMLVDSSVEAMYFKDFVNLNNNLKNIISTLQSVCNVVDIEHIDRLFNNCATTMGIKVDITGISDISSSASMTKLAKLRDLDWMFEHILEGNTLLIDTAYNIATLKKLDKQVTSKAKSLEKEISSSVEKNVHPATLTTLQDKAALHNRIHLFVKGGLTVIATRMVQMDKCFTNIINRAREINKV